MSIRFACAVMDEGKAWAVLRNLSGIVEIDLSSCKSSMLVRFDGNDILEDNLCGAIQKAGDYIAVAPMRGEEFYVYNLKNSLLKKYSIKKFLESKGIDKQKSKFWSSFCDGKNIYFVGCWYPGIVKIDVENESIKMIEIDMNHRNADSKVGVLGRAVGFFSNKAYIPVCGGNEDIIFDLQKEQYSFRKIGNVPHIAISGDERFLCLVSEKGGSIEIYNTDNQVLKKNIRMPERMKGMTESRWFCTSLYHCGYVWIFPYQSNMILRLEMQTGETVCIKEFQDVTEVKYINAGVYDADKVWGFYYKENRLDIIDCQSLSIESKRFFPPDNLDVFFRSTEELRFHMWQTIPEENVNVKTLISYVCNSDVSSENGFSRKCTGADIWKKLIRHY